MNGAPPMLASSTVDQLPRSASRDPKAPGQQRVRSPAETLAWLLPHARAMGVTRLAMITGLDHVGIPVATACRPNSRNLSVSQGKGSTADAAKASALMESVEACSAEEPPTPARRAALLELRAEGLVVVDPATLPRSAGGVVDPERPIRWTRGRDLLREEPVWLPEEVISTDYTVPNEWTSGALQTGTNGLAGGNTLAEALRHAVAEVVERDATARWWYGDDGDRQARRVDLRTIRSEAARHLIDRFTRAGLEVAVWDITSDVAIAAFLAIVLPRGRDRSDDLLAVDGMGCSPSREQALVRALTEAAQTRLTVIAGSRDDILRSYYDIPAARRRAEVLRALARGGDGETDYASVPDFRSRFVVDDLEHELAALAEAGFQSPVAVDLTQVEYRIPVVRVVVPGLEGVCFGADYTPGRRVAGGAR